MSVDSIKKEAAPIAARDSNRKLALLMAISIIDKPTEKDLIDATGMPKRSIHDMIKGLMNLGVFIERVNGRRYGYYQVSNAGAFDLPKVPDVLKLNYPDIYDQIKCVADRKNINDTDVKEKTIQSPHFKIASCG